MSQATHFCYKLAYRVYNCDKSSFFKKLITIATLL